MRNATFWDGRVTKMLFTSSLEHVFNSGRDLGYVNVLSEPSSRGWLLFYLINTKFYNTQ